MSIAVGQMCMSVDEFERLTPAEFFYAWIGWSDNQSRHVRSEWEMLRWQTWVLTCIQLEKKDRQPMQQMFPLPWEEQANTPAEISMQEREKRVKQMTECLKK